MSKVLACHVAGVLFFCSACLAQEISPVIRLTPDEAAKAKQLAEALQSAEERVNRSKAAWQSFYQAYQAAHLELTHVRFSSDFRNAFAYVRRGDRVELSAVELSTAERERAEALHTEMLKAERDFDQARNNWRDYQFRIISAHVPVTGLVSTIQLSTGEEIKVENPWQPGLSFTPDFRLAAPLRWFP